LAGTARQYSMKAIDQLTVTTTQSGRSVNLRCPYQATVMKTLDIKSKAMGRRKDGSVGMMVVLLLSRVVC
jgi:hypothetical protein